MDIAKIKAIVVSKIDDQRQQLNELSLKIHSHPEIGIHEFKAAGWLTEYLAENGFLVECGICALPTAFRGRIWRCVLVPLLLFLALLLLLQLLEVAELGEGVEGLAVGQRVAIEPARSCGRCEWCRTGKPNVCPHVQFCSTPPHNGLMCEFAVLHAEQCVPIPDALSFEEAAMLEPLQVSVHASNLVGVVPGETAAVVGAGCIGLGCMEMAKAGGASRIIVTDLEGLKERARITSFYLSILEETL